MATLAERMERDSVVGAHCAPFRQDLSRKKGFSRSFEPPLESSRRTAGPYRCPWATIAALNERAAA